MLAASPSSTSVLRLGFECSPQFPRSPASLPFTAPSERKFRAASFAARAARFSSKRPGFDKADFGLRSIRLELFCDCVFVNLDDDAESLASLAGEMEAEFNILPGSNELAVYRIRPIDHEWTSFEGDVLTADGRTNDARTTYTANVLAPEDIALCESVQRGLKSKGYDQGPIMAGDTPSGENEYAIHHFHRLVYEALNGRG